ncbi:hypothetical protein AVEN_175212-1 [Araneus ventricosus]|uniref:Uncharacterized protein n=1 Tax=Araneus ventricosus TaxID=182803 RepID=A0A4Y2UVN5_ARAVE|nr:hypothetical protein AVEN_175212-1 [Araneus ventricosus]
MRLDLPSVAVVGDRCGVSDRAVEAIASSVLHDVALGEAQALPLKGLYFDGRKDSTLIEERVATKRHTRKAKEEHLPLIEEPSSRYITHLNPSFGTAKQISVTIIGYFEGIRRHLSQFLAIGCDGTSVNTGWKCGVIRRLKLKLGKPLQWVILHFHELTLRHLFETLDGPTNGPKSYSGNIGKALLTCETLPLTTIEIVDDEIPTTDRRDLNKDQVYLVEISQVARLGNCSDELARRSPGTL